MAVYALDGAEPQLAAGAWVADSAQVIGAVTLGEDASVWFGTVVRGDTEAITIGAGTNIQDASVLHADFGQTLWAIRPDGTHPELIFGNTIIQPNGYASGRQVPGTDEVLCTLVSHFGDINGPLALLSPGEGRMNPAAIHSITPEVPWPGMWPATECFRDPVPLSRDYFLCSHAPADRFGIFVIDRHGNRELLYMDRDLGCMAPTVFRPTQAPPAVPRTAAPHEDGQFILVDAGRGLEGAVKPGAVRYIRVVEEVRHNVISSPNRDHVDFMKWYASPVDLVSGPYGWPSYVAKAPLGTVDVSEDGSASFRAPAGKVLYFQALDANYNELQRMRSVIQLQPGESRSCVGCHEARNSAPPLKRAAAAASCDATDSRLWSKWACVSINSRAIPPTRTSDEASSSSPAAPPVPLHSLLYAREERRPCLNRHLRFEETPLRPAPRHRFRTRLDSQPA